MSSAWHTGSAANGFKLGVINRVDFHRAIVEATALAFREGICGIALDGLAALDAKNQLVVVDRSQIRLGSLKVRFVEERRLAKKLRSLAAKEKEADVADEYRADAREHTLAAKSLEREIGRLESDSHQTPLAAQFEGEVDYLLTALAALLDPAGTVDRDVAQGLDKVLDGLMLRELDDDRLEFSLNWLVPASGTVVRFGPVVGTVRRRGRVMTPAERSMINAGGIDRRIRRQLVHRLENAGFPYNVARAVSVSPFPELSQALLGGEPLWLDVSESFDHHAFNEHLRSSYEGLTAWAEGIYCQTNPKRQALADVVAAMSGEARVDQLRVITRALGIKDTDLLPLTLPKLKEGSPAWEPAARRRGVWQARTTVEANWVESILCATCGRPATAVVRVPEVPGALLCRTCHTSPFALEIEFPGRYVDLALPAVTIEESLLHSALDLKLRTIRKGGAAVRNK